MLRWYLVRTKPSGELRAREHLQRQHYHVYLPRLLEVVRVADRLRERVTALFPRYLFLGLEEGRQSLGPVHSTVGVAEIVRFGNRYAVVPDVVIESLRDRAGDSGLHRLGPRSPFLRGLAVRIASGPFAGLEGVFEREAGAERVVVLLNVLGQGASVRVPAGFVVPAAVGGR